MVELPLSRPDGMTDRQWQAYLQRALRIIKSVTPVRTGQLRDGWRLEDVMNGAMLVNDVPYAEFLNSGTPRMAPRDMTGQTLGQLM